ncbi:MAG: hypothetical protein K6E67_10325 [Prevotella sp.]|nr:hypothetical protein [Prevotella sp.]
MSDGKDKYTDGFLTFAGYTSAILLFLLAWILLTGCSPRVIENTIIRTDTCYVEKWRRDSIFQHDSIYVHEYVKGDTVYRDSDRWHTLWKELVIRDTAYVSRTDTITQAKIEQVAKPLSGWQWIQIWAGRIVIIALALAAAVCGVRRWLRAKLP